MPTRRPRSKKCPSSNTLQYIFLESMLARADGVELHAVDARVKGRGPRYYLLKSGYNIPSTTWSTVPC